MNKRINKAIEDVDFIKNIIEKTSASLLSLSEIFIKLGGLFLLMTAIYIGGTYIPVPILEAGERISFVEIALTIVPSILVLILIVISLVLCRRIFRRNQLYGVSKQVMILWIYTIVLNFICFVLLAACEALNFWNNLYGFPFICIQFFTVAFCLLSIFVFTSFRFPLYLAVVYTLLGFYALISQLPFNIFSSLMLPITLIIIGIYFKYIRIR